MREIKCPACAAEIPRSRLRSKTFSCPHCNEALRVPPPSSLWAIPEIVGGFSLAVVIAREMGLAGNALFFGTLFLGCLMSNVVAAILGTLMGWTFPLQPEPDPDCGLNDDGRVLHIDSSRGSREDQQ